MNRRNKTQGKMMSLQSYGLFVMGANLRILRCVVCREQLLQKEEEIKAAQQFNNGGKSRNWDLIKQKITTAKVTRRTFLMFIENTNKYHKITDALSVLKYEVNGKKVSVLRPLGEGGFSQVYEVYDKVNSR